VWRAPRQGSGPDFYFTDLNATAYVPVGKRSTWAFNYFRSDTHVMNRGQTDTAVLGRELGLDCPAIADPGAGLSMVTASGLVYRLDFATGDEGFQPSVFFQYPWEL
jgi:hypothetical protein